MKISKFKIPEIHNEPFNIGIFDSKKRNSRQIKSIFAGKTHFLSKMTILTCRKAFFLTKSGTYPGNNFIKILCFSFTTFLSWSLVISG